MTRSHQTQDRPPQGDTGGREDKTSTGRRSYDDRTSRVRRLITELTAEGLSPRVIELDGLYVELAAPRQVPVPRQVTDNSNTGQRTAPDNGQQQQPGPQGPRSYRAHAREELRRRIRETEGDS